MRKKADKEILVRDDGTTYPDPCNVVNDQDRVLWYSHSGPWDIKFKKSPFSKSAFHIKKGGGDTGWTSRGKGKKDEKFKYTVSGQGKSVDPDIIIK